MARSITWSKEVVAAPACGAAASRVESCGSGGAVGAGGVCAGEVAAGAVCAGEVCADGVLAVGEVCVDGVSAGGVWENMDAAQQTRESASSAMGERNTFTGFISSLMLDLGY